MNNDHSLPDDLKRVLILGASGMLGHMLHLILARDARLHCIGTVRNHAAKLRTPESIRDLLIIGTDVRNPDSLIQTFEKVAPDVVINCVGLVKQLDEANDPLQAIPINSLLPHQLAGLCSLAKARLIHISTDCVFSGSRGSYSEADAPDALDLYGRSKLLGEVDYLNAITLRTSIIGPELVTNHGLVEWFLSQKNPVKGHTAAVFSGVTTHELGVAIRDYVLPRCDLHGVYHLSADPISKFALLRLVADEYHHAVRIIPDATVKIDRSLDSSRFRQVTGYTPPTWPSLIKSMHEFR